MEKKAEESKSEIWDCGSTLYDSFEVQSFEQKLHSAILNSSSTRSLSMPHLSNHRHHQLPPAATPPPLPSSKQPPKNKSSLIKINSRSIFHKLLRFVFKPKQQISQNKSNITTGSFFKDGYYVERYGYDNLSTIPEDPEVVADGFSPKIGSFTVRRTTSERFTASSISISCA